MFCMEEAQGSPVENRQAGFLRRVFEKYLPGRPRMVVLKRPFGLDPATPTGIVVLPKCDLHVLEMSQSCRISCIDGAAWVTCPGRFCDYILRAGESLSLRGKARIIISGGYGDCTFQIEGR